MTGSMSGALDHRTGGRLEFWRSVADTFGVDVSAVDETLVALAPLTVVELLLPGRSAEERNEIMWGLGEFERRSDAAAPTSTACACAGVCHPAA
jgi:hypothetical protein